MHSGDSCSAWYECKPLSPGFSKGLPHPVNWKLQLLLAHWLFHQERAFLLLFDFLSDPWAAGTAPDSILILTNCPNIPLADTLALPLPVCLIPMILRMFYAMENAEEKVLNLSIICKTSSPNTSANKWIQQCSFSIMGAICVLFSENNAFCKITLNRKCLCCQFWLLTASSQWDLPQHKTDLAVFADWGPTFPDTWNTALMEILLLRFFYLFFLFFFF